MAEAETYTVEERTCRTDILPKEISVDDEDEEEEEEEVEYREMLMHLYCDIRFADSCELFLCVTDRKSCLSVRPSGATSSGRWAGCPRTRPWSAAQAQTPGRSTTWTPPTASTAPWSACGQYAVGACAFKLYLIVITFSSNYDELRCKQLPNQYRNIAAVTGCPN